jgi:hypothetical protein
VPLTPAHAAAVVPLCRWRPYFWASPLVVGSMSPDFAYYVFPPQRLRHFGHTAAGLVLFCIPVGLVVLYVFHRFLKRRLVVLLPRPLRDKLWPHCGSFPLLPPRRLAWVCFLLFLGAVTHVAWDAVTHEDSWAFRGVPQIRSVLFTVAGQPLHPCGILQYGSSLLGLGLLTWWSWQWYRHAPSARSPADSHLVQKARPAIAAALILCGIGVGIACGLLYARNLPGPFSAHEFLEAAFITGADAFGFALLMCMLVVTPLHGSAVDDLARRHALEPLGREASKGQGGGP